MKAELKKRWHTESGEAFVQRLAHEGRSGNGYEIREVPFGIIRETGQLDLRGIVLPEGIELRRIAVGRADLTGAVLNGAWLERCLFTAVCFDSGLLQNVAEHGNTFNECSFNDVSFRAAVIGYHGSRFIRCRFERVDFRKTGFIRPEYNDCIFNACMLNGVDFNGASFENCEFRGLLREVWFRGGFPHLSDSDEFGVPRCNKMACVNFSNAKLFDVSFSNQCDLSSIVPPTDGRHRLFNHWRRRLESLIEKARDWPQASHMAGEAFCKTHLVHAKTQDWYLLGLDDLVEEFGVEIGTQLWEGLQGA